MKAIETTALIGPDRKLTVQLPAGLPTGECRVVIVIDEPKPAESGAAKFPFGGYPVGLVSDSETFRREDLYGDAV